MLTYRKNSVTLERSHHFLTQGHHLVDYNGTATQVNRTDTRCFSSFGFCFIISLKNTNSFNRNYSNLSITIADE